MSSPKLLLSSLLILSFTFWAGAQPPPPAKPSGDPVRIYQPPSLKTLPNSEQFTSTEGRFVVSLPRGLSGFAALSPADLGFTGMGANHKWNLKEGSVSITYIEFLEKSFSITSDEDFQSYFVGIRQSVVDKFGGKILSPISIKTDDLRGIQFSMELPDGKRLIFKSVFGANRQFTILAFPSDAADSSSLISKAFDSFRIVPQSVIDAQLKQSLESSTPAPLPQSPVAPKEKTDAQDFGIKGKVKTITNESEDRSGTWGTQGRKMTSVENYNESGNLTKGVSYDSTGRPFQITVYGYLDGSRVSKNNVISYDDDPPAMMAPSSSQAKPRDNRFSYKYEYKYQNGRQIERQLILNNGEKGMRYVTNYDGNKKESLTYDTAGKLNMKALYTLDDKGNEVEKTYVNVLGNKGGDEKYVVRYESFDTQGNWTKRITSLLINVDDGKEVSKVWFVNYRTIEYY